MQAAGLRLILPSFSLREIFEHQIIPLLEKLVGPPATCGDKKKYQEEKQRHEADPENNSPPIADPSLYGKHQNYGVVVQGDNAGHHREGNFQAWCKEQCQTRSHWYWEPQAAQMPSYSNNLDLAVFPFMSKIHSHLLKEGGEKAIGNNDAIWKRCQDTWSDLISEKVAHGYVLAKRILERVEENGGAATSSCEVVSQRPNKDKTSEATSSQPRTVSPLAPRKLRLTFLLRFIMSLACFDAFGTCKNSNLVCLLVKMADAEAVLCHPTRVTRTRRTYQQVHKG